MADHRELEAESPHPDGGRDEGGATPFDPLAGDSVLPPLATPLLRHIVEGRAQGSDKRSASLPPPESVGPYKIHHLLGEGGMGVVYLAEQKKPVRRWVALKLIKLGMDTKECIARFDSERQALAMMNHPNIARVIDAGSTEHGRPYFVMEYVPGVAITDHCDRHRAGTQERLDLFVQVCSAVQHAHHKGVIHRDLKPSNIMVMIDAGKPVPKIIDFGVAKATNQRLTEHTIFTLQGQIIGTPEYMSPEQADLTAQDIDMRSDIYSLGVLLYELLAGALPFDPQALRRAGYREIQRIIREVEPPRPSTRVSNLGKESTTVAKNRQTAIRALQRELRGDLDWITMKAMAKDRTLRYASASELAADIERHVRHEPILAGPPSVVYRLQKFLRKHWGPVAAGLAVVLALGTGLVVSLVLYAEAKYNGSLAEASATNAKAKTKEAEENFQHARDQGRAARLAQWRAGGMSTRLLARTPGMEIEALVEGIRALGPCLKSEMELPPPPEAVQDLAEAVAAALESASRSFPYRASGPLSGCFFLRGGSLLAAAAWDGTVRFWGLREHCLLGVLPLHEGAIICAALSADERRLATGSVDGSASILDLEKSVPAKCGSPASRKGLAEVAREAILRLEGMTAEVTAIAFSPDGALVAAGCGDGTCGLWETASGRRRHALIGHSQAVRRLAFSPPGRESRRDGWRAGFLATASVDQSVRLWEVSTGTEVQTLTAHAAPVNWVEFSSDGRWLATASDDHTARLWRGDSARQGTALRGHGAQVLSARFLPSADAASLVTTGADATARVWSLATGEATAVCRGHLGPVWDSAVAPGAGDTFLTAGSDHTVRRWSAVTGALLGPVLDGHSGEIHALIASSDGKQAATASWDGTVRVWTFEVGSLADRPEALLRSACSFVLHQEDERDNLESWCEGPPGRQGSVPGG